MWRCGLVRAVCRIFADSRRVLLLGAVEQCALDALAMPGEEDFRRYVPPRPARLHSCSFAATCAVKKVDFAASNIRFTFELDHVCRRF